MYNPNEVGKKGSIFGLPYTVEESLLVFLPIHLDVTSSFGDGASDAPRTIMEVSTQLDLSLPHIHTPWNCKMAMLDDLMLTEGSNQLYREKARKVITHLEDQKTLVRCKLASS